MNAKRIVGIDLGTRGLVACYLVGKKETIVEVPFTQSDEPLGSFLRQLEKTDLVILEAGMGAFTLYEQIVPHVKEVIVVNPRRIAMITGSTKKTDRNDARVLAKICSKWDADELNRVRVPDEMTQNLRALISQRSLFKKDHRAKLQALWNLLINHGVHGIERGKLKTVSNRLEWIKKLKPKIQIIAMRFHAVATDLESVIDTVENDIRDQINEMNSEDALLLASIPGIGLLGIASVLAFGNDIASFPDGERFAAHTGLTPKTDNSGLRVRQNRISKQGNPILRTQLIEAVWVMVRSRKQNIITSYYMRLKQRRGAGRAVVAAARKLATVIYAMLNSRQVFQGTDHEWTLNKMKRIKLNHV